ncbi:MAG: ATP-binding cassette domain-containing protein [Alphaproteobacteria bacterium]|nr:MAG: ATP-binding cassette domain-containing protein [Alphaproteobacteria bacterium]
MFAILIASGAVLAFGQGLRGIIDHGLNSEETASLDHAFEIMLAIIAVLSGASMVRMYTVSAIGERVVADLRKDLYAHLLTLPPSFFEITKVGEILSRLTADTTQVQSVVSTSFPIALRNSVLLIGAAFMLFLTSAKLAGIVSFVVPMVIGPLILVGRKVRVLSRTAQDRIADISSYGDETLNLIKTVQAYTHESIDLSQFQNRADAALHSALARISVRAVLSALIIGLVFSAIAIVLWIGGYDVLSGTITGGQLASFVFYSILVAGSVAALSEVVSDLQRAAGSLERIIELLHTPSSLKISESPLPLPKTIDKSTPILEFNDVDFHYPSRNQPALQQFNLQAMDGESVGVVGSSGAGKTTIFQLALRFYDPQKGSVKFCGVNVRDVNPTDLRSRIAYVGQEPAIFSASLLDNIRYGKVDATEDQVRIVCKLAKVDEFFHHLPDGIHTFLGEKGARLSGGQKQRIAIARAMLRNPDLLLLDEATSQLDSENEKLVQAALEKLAQGRTTITIAHRLSTLRNASRIIVLDAGQIVGQGRHDELIQSNPTYQNLAQLQIAA